MDAGTDSDYCAADAMTKGLDPFDAVLLLSFGGPEGMGDVLPFLRNVTRGRDVPPQRLRKVAAQYQTLGGISPINEQNRALRAKLEAELVSRGEQLPVYWGNRNWHPMLADTLRTMRSDGVRHGAVIVTSGYSSYSGCRQYRENLFDAVAEVESAELGAAPRLDKLRLWFDSPGFIATMIDNTVAAWGSLDRASDARLVFCTHSIPVAQADRTGPPPDFGAYVAQHRFVAQAVAAAVSEHVAQSLEWDLVYQSRSGSPNVSWLEPDVSDYLETAAAQGCEAVVLVPIGFASDHLEVIWDLDMVAMTKARELGMAAARAATAGLDPRFVAALADTVMERQRGVPMSERSARSPWGPWPDECPVDCCLGSDSDVPRPTQLPRPTESGNGNESGNDRE